MHLIRNVAALHTDGDEPMIAALFKIQSRAMLYQQPRAGLHFILLNT